MKVYLYRKSNAQGVATHWHPLFIENPAFEVLGIGELTKNYIHSDYVTTSGDILENRINDANN